MPNDPAAIRATTTLVEPELAQRTIVVIYRDGRVITGARAIFTIVASCGGMLPVFTQCLKQRPISLLFEPGYRVFALYRGRLARFFPDPE